jgi:CHAT domain-containing protein
MGQNFAQRFAGLPNDISQAQLSLENKLAKTRQDLAKERSKPVAGLEGELIQNQERIKNLEQREQTLQTELYALQEKIRTEYPDYYALKYPKPVSLDTLQTEVLKPDELMLVYGVMENSTTLWVISKDTFQVFDLPLTEKRLTEKVKEIRLGVDWQLDTRTFERTDIKEPLSEKKLSELTYELYNGLFPYPVRPLMKKSGTVYIVPTGILYALPFEMLVTKKAKRKTDTLRYLIEEVPIAYLTSASLLKILRDTKKRRVQTAQYPLLAFANPVYDGSDFRPLPNTADEASAIAHLFNPPPPAESEPLQLGENASVKKVSEFNDKTRLDDYQYLLFATHGVIPGKSNVIDQPALVLSHPKPNGDGYLKMKDVFGNRLKASH